MVEINSNDYHDFVIKNGKLIGEFEQMYKKSAQIPWQQDEQENSLNVRLAIELLRCYSPFDFICDFGSGLGFFLDILYRELCYKNAKLIAYDVSKTCCEKGKHLFPHINFINYDLMLDGCGKQNLLCDNISKKNLFVLRGTLWYVYPAITQVVANIGKEVNNNDLLLISQNFPPLSSDFCGKEIIPNHEAIISYFNPFFEPLKTIIYEENKSSGNDNWFIGIFVRRDYDD